MAELYLITCTTSGKQYVGVTARTTALRWSEHIKNARRSRDIARPSLLVKAIRKHGEQDFIVRTLLRADWGYALNLEQAAIERFGSRAPAGYNAATGGRQWQHTEESKARISAAHKGKSLSSEHRAKLSQAKRGIVWPRDVVEKRAASNRGRAHKPFSEVTRRKMSAARFGKKASAMTRRKMSQSQLERWAARKETENGAA